MLKKGQIAIFIIIGVIILAAVLFFFYYSNQLTAIKPSSAADIGAVNAFVENCVEQTAQDDVIETSLSGGDVFSGNYTYFLWKPTALYFYNGVDLAPSDDTIKNSLKYYMDNALQACTNKFEKLKAAGYTIEEGDVNSKVTVTSEKVTFEVEYPLNITKSGSTTAESKFSADVKVNIPKMINASRAYINFQTQNPDALRLGNLMDICNERGLMFRVYNSPEGDTLITLIDNSTLVRNEPYVYAFALWYNWTAI